MQVVRWVFISITSAPVSVTESHAVVQSHRLHPCPDKVRSQRELQNTFFTKWVPYESWFAEQQRIMKQGGRILKVELCSGRPQVNVGN